MDAAVAPGDFPRPPGVSRAQTRLWGVRAGEGLPLLGLGPIDPDTAAKLLKGPEVEHLLELVGR